MDFDLKNARPPLVPRLAAVEADAMSRVAVDLRTLWPQLLDGELKVIDDFCTEDRCYLTVTDARGARRRRRCLTSRNVAIVERILLGDSQKAIAFDFSLAPSTVALIAGRCLQALGLTCSATTAPVLIVMAAHSSRSALPAPSARQTILKHEGSDYRIISARRPDECLDQVLPVSECAVARLRVEGHTHAEIARLRSTSPRTVANQLSTTFHRLRVSGRVHLLHHLICSESRTAVA